MGPPQFEQFTIWMCCRSSASSLVVSGLMKSLALRKSKNEISRPCSCGHLTYSKRVDR